MTFDLFVYMFSFTDNTSKSYNQEKSIKTIFKSQNVSWQNNYQNLDYNS